MSAIISPIETVKKGYCGRRVVLSPMDWFTPQNALCISPVFLDSFWQWRMA